ncbi:TonB family protein [Sphingopyxis sp.]|uniref:TonB family protein n=1 Tax=Sphingopyxis sp. TaxID=1908224 RepID=UPI003D0C7507
MGMKIAGATLVLLASLSAPVTAQGPTAGAAPECAASASCGRKPTPRGSPNGWISGADYPAGASGDGRVSVTLVVDTGGRPISCVVTQSSGVDLFDQAACSALQRRARFNPALDAYGRPTVGNYPTRASFIQNCTNNASAICIDLSKK